MRTFRFGNRSEGDLVSIVIPTFNKDRFIGATLASIGQQTYRNWELIVVEDSSRGETERIVKQFAAAHPRNRVDYSRNERNSGAAYSRNVGFTKALGQYVALLDADDRWLPDYLALHVEALKDTGKDLVYSSVLMIEDETDLPLAVWGPDRRDLNDFPYGLFRRNFITPSATVMRREVLRDVGPWGLGFRYCEDADYWFKCVAAGKQFHHIGGCHCWYRKNHDGATTQQLCGTIEEFATIAERYVKLPGLKQKHAAKYTAHAFLNAAQLHAKTNPKNDPSADRSRAARLAFKAWTLRRNHMDYLWRSARYAVKGVFHRRRQLPTAAQPAGAGAIAASSTKAAA